MKYDIPDHDLNPPQDWCGICLEPLTEDHDCHEEPEYDPMEDEEWNG